MATNVNAILPEQVLTATLHRAGESVRIRDDVELVHFEQSRNIASRKRVYAIQMASAVPSLTASRRHSSNSRPCWINSSRKNASQSYFKISEHTRGPYGETVYNQLPPKDRQLLDEVASEIRSVFGPK